MPITLLRDEESVFNADPRNDTRDCGLTQRGKRNCARIRSPIVYDLVICSPLKRARETLRYSNLRYRHVGYNPLFREQRTNLCDLMAGEEVVFESEEQIVERIERAKQQLWIYTCNEAARAKNILIVGHGDFFFYLTATYRLGEYFGKWLGNGEMHVWR